MNMLLYLSQQVRIVVMTTPAGSNTDVQYNDNGAFGGDGGLTYDKNTVTLSISGSVGASLSGNGTAGHFHDAANTVDLCGGTVAINITGKIGMDQIVAASTLGTLIGKISIYDGNGTRLGDIPIYDTIT